jgi:putative ABC transport system substrate-binding protein
MALNALLVRGAAIAQQRPKIHRIGFLGSRSRSTATNPDPFYDAFVRGLRDAGYVDGANVTIEWRLAEGRVERLPELAEELVRMRPEVIVTHATPATLAARRATKTIPIVFAAVSDPVRNELAESLARPGGNVTGLSQVLIDTSPKQIELLRLVAPTIKRLGCFVNFQNRAVSWNFKSIEAAAEMAGMSILPMEVRNSEDIERGLVEIPSRRIEALVVLNEPTLFPLRYKIAEYANRIRLPTVCGDREYVVAGGLMSYGANTTELYYRAAGLVDMILRGKRPTDIPIEQPTTLQLVLNRKVARTIGVAFPNELLLRADEIIV